jgi:hypothetical protein
MFIFIIIINFKRQVVRAENFFFLNNLFINGYFISRKLLLL